MTAGTLLIRADASQNIGVGHVMRCLALAEAQRDRGERAAILSDAMPSGLEERFRSEDVEVLRLASAPGSLEDGIETSETALKIGAKWVVSDGYHLGTDIHRTIKDHGLSLLQIDDTGFETSYIADAVLNQNIYADESLYAARSPYTKLLLGPKYALLRREFTARNNSQLSARRCESENDSPESAKVSTVIVTFGGSDPGNATIVAVRALALLASNEIEARIILGPANLESELIAKEIGSGGLRARLLKSVDDMAEQIAWADIAISAAGSTCWELALLGKPAVVVILAENQEAIASGLAEAGIARNAGWHHSLTAEALAEHIRRLITDAGLRRRMSRLGRKLVDGAGAARVAEFLAVN